MKISIRHLFHRYSDARLKELGAYFKKKDSAIAQTTRRLMDVMVADEKLKKIDLLEEAEIVIGGDTYMTVLKCSKGGWQHDRSYRFVRFRRLSGDFSSGCFVGNKVCQEKRSQPLAGGDIGGSDYV